MDMASTCSRLAEIEYRLYEKWKEKEGTFDLTVRQAENYVDGSFLMVAFVDEMITCFFGMILWFLLFKLTGYE